MSYYDILLASIPVAMGIGLFTTLHPAVALHQGITIGSLLSMVVLVEALFRNPPTKPGGVEAAAIVLVSLGWLSAGFLYLL